MEFQSTSIKDVYHIILAPHQDERGWFARSYCEEQFSLHKLCTRYVQNNISTNHQQYILRGLHFQKPPYAEDKIVRCAKGKIFDVVVDLRQNSASYGKTFTVELDENQPALLYIPKGCAHGYMTLSKYTEVLYQMSEVYHPESASGIAWDSSLLNIHWPSKQPILSEQDKQWPQFHKEKSCLAI